MAERKNTTLPPNADASHQLTYEEAGELLSRTPRHDLLLIAYNSLRIAVERDGQTEHANANRSCLVAAAGGCALLLERAPELVVGHA